MGQKHPSSSSQDIILHLQFSFAVNRHYHLPLPESSGYLDQKTINLHSYPLAKKFSFSNNCMAISMLCLHTLKNLFR